MDLEALIEALQMGENINSGVDLKWGGYKVIDGGKGGAGPNRKPRGELPPALQKKDPPPKPSTELTDDYILDEIRKFKKEHPTKESLESVTSKEAEFINLLLKGYDNSIRPVIDETTVTNVTIIPNSLSVLLMDQAEETVNLAIEFVLQWHDEFLNWDRNVSWSQNWIKVRESMVWVPDTTVSTSIEMANVLDDKDRYLDIKYDGTVRQSIYAIYTNLCNMKVDRFPYDSQICRIAIGPWSYTAKEVWVSAGPNISKDTHDFELRIKRRPTFYVWVLLIPTYIISTVSIFGLFIPTNNLGEREERVNLGLTTLLSSAVILQIVANAMPKTSALPLLGNFILAEIFVVALGVLCSIVVLSLHNRAHTREWKPPNWILTVLNLSGSKKFLKKNKTKILAKQSIDEGIIDAHTDEGPNMKIFFVLFSLYYVFNSIESYKILVYTPLFGHSHVKFMGSIADSLAEAGHDVTVLMPLLEVHHGNKTGVTLVKKVILYPGDERSVELTNKFGGTQEESGKFNMWELESSFSSMIGMLDMMSDIVKFQCQKMMNDKELLDKLRAEKFDLGIAEPIGICQFGIKLECLVNLR
ncbi:hypothetical protein WR25_06166 isoform E [Diploscapter pachys]|uniref:Uncharacterized protein n=1 Tax=Diploscapter pachys TaxID=2018661 RepID=A0A2A2LTQ8_9BILA|nr:hypothetical protein WR25_06166 isoform A [Diploscapter pachys]PAV89506.1 hypothetical protein WR25_06166 isoform B [Diploscapter pachys]PAV89507.1 hypothetical protein WR25_06166 isoform C [Diploscapter pachys]PAV89508.1 hypothetical protein WR25_06166 isoform D [Diploscapter pachys]PAV89509.1 hypothetical protein WR25_06166 isoform E [Diploscapter pachys]